VTEPANDRPRPQPTPDGPGPFSFERFGRAFIDTAVTEERVESGVGSLAGKQIAFGPTGVGPAKLIKVTATGMVGRPIATRIATPGAAPASFALDVPIQLNLTVDLGLDKSRFAADVVVHLRPTARPAAPLAIFFDVPPITADDVDVTVAPDGVGASVLQSLARVDREIAKAVARYVVGELAKPEAVASRTVDLVKTVSGAPD
jgi:hypothetical protein